jgi:uncharacterized phage protein (TIGR02220 family)
VARKRMIDPEFWSDEDIGKWTHSARLLYIGLWNFADDTGRFKANSMLLKSQIFPYDKNIDIDKLKIELGSKIKWYGSNGSSYGYINNFSKYQKIDRPTPSKLPDPEALVEDSSSCKRGLVPNRIEVNRREVNRKEDLIMLSKLNLEEPIVYLNEKTKRTFDPKNQSSQELVRARANEGRTMEDFRRVIDKKAKDWLTDDRMHKYLRPSTLFNRTNFENYLNEPEATQEDEFRKKWMKKEA